MTVVRLSAKQVAERWGCSTRLILDHISSGTIPAVNIGRAGSKKPRYRISEADLEKFEESRAVRVVSAPTRRRKKNPNVIEFFLFLIAITATFATANAR